jgi:hypothetical protein
VRIFIYKVDFAFLDCIELQVVSQLSLGPSFKGNIYYPASILIRYVVLNFEDQKSVGEVVNYRERGESQIR